MSILCAAVIGIAAAVFIPSNSAMFYAAASMAIIAAEIIVYSKGN